MYNNVNHREEGLGPIPFPYLEPIKDVEYCIFPSNYLRMTRTFLLHRPIIRAADSQLD